MVGSFLLFINISLSLNLPLRYEAKSLKASPTGTSRQLSMTHVHWKLLSWFITPLLSFHQPSLVILLSSNKPIDSEQVNPPTQRAGFKSITSSSCCLFLLYETPTDITSWVTTPNICPESWEHKLRGRLEGLVWSMRNSKEKSWGEAAQEDFFFQIFVINQLWQYCTACCRVWKLQCS